MTLRGCQVPSALRKQSALLFCRDFGRASPWICEVFWQGFVLGSEVLPGNYQHLTVLLPAWKWELTEEQWAFLNVLKSSGCPLWSHTLFTVSHDPLLAPTAFPFGLFFLVQAPAASLYGFRQADGRRLSGTCLRSVGSLEWETPSQSHTGPTLTLQGCTHASACRTRHLPTAVLPHQNSSRAEPKSSCFHMVSLLLLTWSNDQSQQHHTFQQKIYYNWNIWNLKACVLKPGKFWKTFWRGSLENLFPK